MNSQKSLQCGTVADISFVVGIWVTHKHAILKPICVCLCVNFTQTGFELLKFVNNWQVKFDWRTQCRYLIENNLWDQD